MDLLLICLVFKKAHSTFGSEFLTTYHKVSRALGMKSHSLKQALTNFFMCTHTFHCVDELFARTDDMYCWLIWLCKLLHCNNFICLVCFCTFLTCSTSYCLVTASGIYGMYICMYVCMYVRMYVCMYVCIYISILSVSTFKGLQFTHRAHTCFV